MLSLLKEVRKFVNGKDLVCIVLGNESCDLDSAVCAVTLAYLYQSLQNQGIKLKHTSNANHFLPVLNIPREDYALKTEVQYVFQKHGISEKDLTFRNDLHDDFLSQSDFILVDHHVSHFTPRSVQIFDHRPLDETQQLLENCQLILKKVGSCATIIAEQYFNHECTNKSYEGALSMLYETIILDTVNFDATVARGTPSDVAACEKLEKILNGLPSREQTFAKLVEARSNVSSLTALQLLRKDLKVVRNRDGSIKVALCGFPMSVHDFILKDAAFEHIDIFAQQNKCNIVLLMGLKIEDSKKSEVKRDIGIIDINNTELWSAIRQELLKNANLNLNLQPISSRSTGNVCFYQQQNVKTTRKDVLPVIQNMIESWKRTSI